MVGGSAEAMVGVLLFHIGNNSYIGWCINSLGVVFDDEATRVMLSEGPIIIPIQLSKIMKRSSSNGCVSL